MPGPETGSVPFAEEEEKKKYVTPVPQMHKKENIFPFFPPLRSVRLISCLEVKWESGVSGGAAAPKGESAL